MTKGPNVETDDECPECERLREEAIQWRDWQSLDQGVFCSEHEE